MQFSIEVQTLKSALAVLSHAFDKKRCYHPVLGMYRVEVADFQLKISATDLSCHALWEETCVDAVDGVFYLKQEVFEVLKTSKQDDIFRLEIVDSEEDQSENPVLSEEFVAEEDQKAITAIVKCGSSFTAKFHHEAIGGFPDAPTGTFRNVFAIPGTVFTKLAKTTLFCASPDETKMILTGVNFRAFGESVSVEKPTSDEKPTEEPTSGCVQAATTDGHKMAWFPTDTPWEHPTALSLTLHASRFPLILAALNAAEAQKAKAQKAKAQTKKAKKAEKDEIILFLSLASKEESSFGSVAAKIQIEDFVIQARLLEEQFPNYQLLIPKHFEREFNLKTAEFRTALQQILFAAEDTNRIIQLQFSSKTLTIASISDAAKVKTTVELFQSVDEFTIAINAKYLLGALNSFEGENLTLQVNKVTSPIVFHGNGQWVLMMPIQLREKKA